MFHCEIIVKVVEVWFTDKTTPPPWAAAEVMGHVVL